MMCRDEYIGWACNVDLRMLCDAKYMQSREKGGIEWMGYVQQTLFYLEGDAALYYGTSQMAQGPAHCFPQSPTKEEARHVV